MHLIAVLLVALAAPVPTPDVPETKPPMTPWHQTVQPAACCKVCHKGKACGDSCISRSYTCHQPPGCACDG